LAARTKFRQGVIRQVEKNFGKIWIEVKDGKMVMSKVWITGIAGFLGSHLADALLAAGHEVGGNDNLSQGDISNVPAGVDFFEYDCNWRDKLVVAMEGYTHLIHCAAAPYEGLSFFSPDFITRNIVGASVSTFSAAIGAGIKRIVYCSSMARYGTGALPFVESHEPHPADPYGIGKVAGEAVLRNLCETHDVGYVIAIPQNIIGPRARYDDPFRGVTSIMINLALQNRDLIIYGDGEQKRLFSPVDSCVDALMRMTFDHVNGEMFNIGPAYGSEITINALAEMVWRLCGHNGPARIKYVPERTGDVKFAYCSVEKAKRVLGFTEGMSLGECIVSMVEDVRKRGVRPFRYDLPIEIRNHKTPAAWTERLF
jgi:UDP-glucose 4-epimerase